MNECHKLNALSLGIRQGSIHGGFSIWDMNYKPSVICQFYNRRMWVNSISWI